MANRPIIDKHRGHPKTVIPRDRKKQGPGQHYGEVRCRLCNEFVRFASKEEVINHLADEHLEEIKTTPDWPITRNTAQFCKEFAEYKVDGGVVNE